MPGQLGKAWDKIWMDKGSVWAAATSTTMAGRRSAYRGSLFHDAANKANRPLISYAARSLAGAMAGGAIGGAWGAISDNESIVGGALKGAAIGAIARPGLRALNKHFSPAVNGVGGMFKDLRAFTNISSVGQVMNGANLVKENMNKREYRALRNWIMVAGTAGAIQGAMSGKDNPVAGAIGGAWGGVETGMLGHSVLAGLRR